MISRKLVTLKNDVPVKDKIEDFAIKEIKKDKLYNFLREMEFNRLLSQAISFYGEPDKEKILKSTKIDKIDVTKYETIISEKHFTDWIEKLKKQTLISVDTETSSLNPIIADLVWVSFCYQPGKACYIPIKSQKEKCLSADIVLKKIKPIL